MVLDFPLVNQTSTWIARFQYDTRGPGRDCESFYGWWTVLHPFLIPLRSFGCNAVPKLKVPEAKTLPKKEWKGFFHPRQNRSIRLTSSAEKKRRGRKLGLCTYNVLSTVYSSNIRIRKWLRFSLRHFRNEKALSNVLQACVTISKSDIWRERRPLLPALALVRNKGMQS